MAVRLHTVIDAKARVVSTLAGALRDIIILVTHDPDFCFIFFIPSFRK